MNFKHLKKIARGTRVLSQLHGYKQISSLAKNNLGMELETNFSGPILVLAPHPDDDIFGCGGMLAQCANTKTKAIVLYLTNGTHGAPDGKQNAKLEEIRQVEAKSALKLLGEITSIFWEYDDGSFTSDDTKIKKLTNIIDSTKPLRVFVPWFGESNFDHQETFSLFVKTLKQSPNLFAGEIWQYEVWSPLFPNRIVPIGKVIESKKAAIAAHQSQQNSRLYSEGIIGLNAYRGAINNLGEPAEAFFALPAKQFLEFAEKILKLPY